MHIAFRTDASIQIGIGHLMRCLTLADAMRDSGARCTVICRQHPGDFLALVRQRGHEAIALPMAPPPKSIPNDPAHAAWLGTDWAADAEQTQQALAGQAVDWLVVDHYALDSRWEQALRPYCRKLMVIDDLADRPHSCDLLLDQNLVADIGTRYKGLVPPHCIGLLGPRYALLRPEFNKLRDESLARRVSPKIACLLVFLGGTDEANETSKVVDGIKICNLNIQRLDVVVGAEFQWIDALKKKLEGLKSARLHIQTPDMAELMLASDLAITAGGSITWEKCAMGLPSLVVISGDNQYPIADQMHKIGAQKTLGWSVDLTPPAYAQALESICTSDLMAMTKSAQAICDGSAVSHLVRTMSYLL